VLQPNQQLGQYRIVRFLGEGGMGAVYEALHVELNRRVALKTLKEQVENLPTVLERFLREGRAAARIRHPHVVDVLDAGQAEGTAFLVMEFLEGEDLEVLLRRETRLPVARVIEIMVPVMAAVDAVHRQGIIHRDLKPQNIFLTKGPYGEPAPKVLDFGISKVASSNSNLTSVGEALGSPFYMSPEQARGVRSLDARSDQFSLAVILYELLTGVRPFDAPNPFAVLVAIQTAAAVPLRERLPDLPAPLGAAIARAMAREPAERFESVLGFGRELLPFASERTRVLWTPLFGAAAAAEPGPDPGSGSGAPREDRTVMRANPLEEGEPAAAAPRRQITGSTRAPSPSMHSMHSLQAPGSPRAPSPSPSGSMGAPRAVTGSLRPSPSPSGSMGAPRAVTGSLRPSPSPSGSMSAPRAATGSLRPSPASSGSMPAPRAVTGSLRAPSSSVPSQAARRDTPPAPPRVASPPAQRPRRRVDSPAEQMEKAAPRTESEMPAAPAGGRCLCVATSDPAAQQRVCEAVRASPRLVLLLEAKGPDPEERPPLVQILDAAGDAIDVVVLVDDGRHGWRQPMVEVCRELAPDRQDAPRCYLFFERAEPVHAIHKGSTNPLADAAKVTEWIARRVPGTRRFRR
jgi:serine/threonine-protein kinase